MNSKFGSRNTKSAKLTATAVMDMRESYASGTCTQGDLARKYRISGVQVGRILRGESWTSLPLPGSPDSLEEQAARVFARQDALREEKLSGQEEEKKEKPDPMEILNSRKGTEKPPSREELARRLHEAQEDVLSPLAAQIEAERGRGAARMLEELKGEGRAGTKE